MSTDIKKVPSPARSVRTIRSAKKNTMDLLNDEFGNIAVTNEAKPRATVSTTREYDLTSIKLDKSFRDNLVSVGTNKTVAASVDEEENMSDPKTYSTKGFPLAFFHSLIGQWGGREALHNLTTTEVCVKFVKPLTERSGLSLCAQYAVSPSSEDASLVKHASWFVSHAWLYKFMDVIDALDEFCHNNNLDPAKEIFWFDLFSNSQHNIESKTFEWWQTTFMNAVKKIGNVVMVLFPCHNPIPLTRCWCIFEIYASSMTGSSFHVATVPSDSGKFLEHLFSNIREYNTLLAQVSCEKSTAYLASDKDAIFALVTSTVGFGALDQRVFSTLSKWVVQTCESWINKYGGSKDFALKVLSCQHALGSFHSLQGRYGEAEPLLVYCLERRKLHMGPKNLDTLATLNELGVLLNLQGKHDESEKLLIQCMQIHKEAFGSKHPATLTAMNNLAHLYKSSLVLEIFNKAELLYSECLKLRKHVLGERHPETLSTLNDLAHWLLLDGKLQKVKPLFVEVLDLRKQVLGIRHPDTLMSMNNLGVLYLQQAQYKKAEPLLVECLQFRKRVLGSQHPDTLISLNNLALLYKAQSQYAKAQPLFVEVLASSKQVLGEDHPKTQMIQRNINSLNIYLKK
ncbi:Tetratricopeptide repeat-domain-containing protein [Chytriomyces sp. MP71]|nr:Tetratricopeptide repeat-domain-containing protein [Chytriomyces sp. MP71]